jgi:hypothetical protein
LKRNSIARSIALTIVLYSAITGAALASWEVKTIPLPAGGIEGGAFGVSCTSTTYCAEVGHSSEGLIWGAAGAEWNGTSWAAAKVQANPGNKNGDLLSVWCWAEKKCRAAGTYGKEGVGYSLIEPLKEGEWKQIASPSPKNGKNAEFKGIACTSAAFCLAAGEFVNTEGGGEKGAVFADEWEGEEWIALSPIENPGGQKNGQMHGTSCSAEGVCVSAGSWGTWEPLVERYISQAGSESWNKSTKKWAAVAAPEPATAKFGMFYSISCKSATFCMAVGAWSENISGGPYKALGDTWNGTGWTLVLSSAGPEGSTENAMHGVSCITSEECELVGSAKNKSGVEVSNAYIWKATKWERQEPPNPSGAKASSLEAISCTAAAACNAVGTYTNSSGRPGPFGEVY